MIEGNDSLALILIATAAFLGAMAGGTFMVDVYQGRAIEHGAAIYAPDTGDFTWIEKK